MNDSLKIYFSLCATHDVCGMKETVQLGVIINPRTIDIHIHLNVIVDHVERGVEALNTHHVRRGLKGVNSMGAA
jgi:hypothetical protein